MQTQLTQELDAEFAAYERSLSSAPLLIERGPHQSWVRRMQDKVRSVYAAITCTRTSDVVQHQTSVRPPRQSTPRQHPRQQEPPHLRHHPRPRVAEQSTPRPPPPEQAGGSSWQHPQSSFDNWQEQFRYQAGGSSWQHPQSSFDNWQEQSRFHAGGSSWQQQSPARNFDFRPQTQPQGMYISIFSVQYHSCSKMCQ